jgi:hypothetical protein
VGYVAVSNWICQECRIAEVRLQENVLGMPISECRKLVGCIRCSPIWGVGVVLM